MALYEGAETHRALHRAHRVHRVRRRMQRFSAMYTLSEGTQGRGENTLKWETFVGASSPLPPRQCPQSVFYPDTPSARSEAAGPKHRPKAAPEVVGPSLGFDTVGWETLLLVCWRVGERSSDLGALKNLTPPDHTVSQYEAR